MDLMCKHFKSVDLNLMRVPADEHLKMYSEGVSKLKGIKLSLDKWYKGDFQLKISRVFKPYSYQSKKLGYHVENLEEFRVWCYSLPPKAEVCIIDDDVASGGTIHAAGALVEEYRSDIEFSQHTMFNNAQDSVKFSPYHCYHTYDVIDMRDFIPGALHGGLLCTFGNDLKRMLYMYPAVNLHTRMRMPMENVISFTKELKELQTEYFGDVY